MTQPTDAEVAIAAAEAGAEVLRSLFGTPLHRYAKIGTDFATQADLEAERAITEVIRSARPDDAVIGEEFGATGSADRTWLIDPLCGTLNFASQNPMFSVNVALNKNVAAVAQPLTNEIFWTDGTQVYIRHAGTDTPAAPSPTATLVDVDTDASSPAAALLANPAAHAAFPLRVFSTTLTLAWVAIGRQAAYIADAVTPTSVHYAAGLTLCQATNATLTDHRGHPLHTTPGLVATATPTLNTQLRTYLRAPK